MNSVCVIPSRAGTKNKGLWKLRDSPLIEWTLNTCLGNYCNDYRRVIIATNQSEIGNISLAYSARWYWRTEEEADGNHLVDTLLNVAKWGSMGNDVIMHVCQPTSPFLRRCDLRMAELTLADGTYYDSYQTIIPIPHNFHGWNQREVVAYDNVRFVDHDRRMKATTKQVKPPRFAFGNLVSVRVGALRKHRTPFAGRCTFIQIPRWYGLDVDDTDDLALAHTYLDSGLVTTEEILA